MFMTFIGRPSILSSPVVCPLQRYTFTLHLDVTAKKYAQQKRVTNRMFLIGVIYYIFFNLAKTKSLVTHNGVNIGIIDA